MPTSVWKRTALAVAVMGGCGGVAGTPFVVTCDIPGGDTSDQCGQRLADALADSTQSVLELDDGTYTRSSLTGVQVGGANPTNNVFTISRDVIVRAKNLGQVILDGLQETSGLRVIGIDSGTATLQGLNITGGYLNPGGGIHINGAGVRATIIDTNIYANKASHWGAGVNVGMEGDQTMTNSNGQVDFVNSNIFDNDSKYGGGVTVWYGTARFTLCTVYGNSAWGRGGGLYIQGGATVSLHHTEVSSNTAGESSNIHGTFCAWPAIPTDTPQAGQATLCPAPPPPPPVPPASPPSPYAEEASISFGPSDEHKLNCKYTIGPNGDFDMANTGCSFEMHHE